MWIKFVVGFPSLVRDFSLGIAVFHSSKTNISQFKFGLESEGPSFVGHNRMLTVTLLTKLIFLFIFIYNTKRLPHGDQLRNTDYYSTYSQTTSGVVLGRGCFFVP